MLLRRGARTWRSFLRVRQRAFVSCNLKTRLRAVTEDVFEQLVDDGVVYAEIRFAPLLHLEQGLSAERVVAVVERAADELVRATGVEAGLILCTLRHFSVEQSLETARLVERFRGSRVVALDIAGDEAGFPLDAHVGAYRFARERGLARTAHAGEACGPESVWETLRLLDPQRIGHGVRSIEDARLVEHLKREGIHLEVCPSSNVQIVPEIARWEDHPVDRLYRAGVRLNLNTDTRMLNPVTLSGEYEGMATGVWVGDGGISQDEFDGSGGGVCFGMEVKERFEEDGGGGVRGNRIVTRTSCIPGLPPRRTRPGAPVT